MPYIGATPTPIPLTATDIPDLPATKITSGTFPALNGSNLTNISAGKVLQVVTNHDNTEKALSTGTTMTNYSELNTSITPSATNSKILVMINFGAISFGRNDASLGYGQVRYQISGGSVQDMAGSEQLGANTMSAGDKHQFAVNLHQQDYRVDTTSMTLLHEPNTTTSTSYQVFVQAEGSSGVCKINKNYRDSGNDYSTISTMTLMEIGA